MSAAWHSDPSGRHQLRWWDGMAWTDHVTDNGVASVDPVGAQAPAQAQPVVPQGNLDPTKFQNQLARAGAQQGGAWQGDGTVWNEPVLVVNQKAKLIELTNQYAVFDQQGRQIAGVQEIGQSSAKKVLRALTNVDQFLTHRYELRGMDGAPLLSITRPRKVFKSTVIVERPGVGEVGRIVQDNVFGKIHFSLNVGEHTYGSINAENWRAWNFNIQDHTGTEIARITKTFVGLAKAMFTTADNYVVQIHRPLEDPLRSLVIAAAVTVDTALKQDEN